MFHITSLLFLICLFISNVYSLEIGQIVKNTQNKEYILEQTDFDISSENIKKQLINKGVNQMEVSGFFKKLKFTLKNSEYNSYQITFTVSQNLGSLSFYHLVGKKNDDKIILSYYENTFSASIAPIYDHHRNCWRGERKYFVVGPRKEHCEEIKVQRGLNVNEIKEVRQKLFNHAISNKNN